MKTKVIDTLDRLSKKVEELYGTVVPEFDITYTKRTGLGTVHTNRLTKHIRMNLNAGLLEEFGDAYIEEVVIHEFAHVITKGLYKYRVKPHGYEYQKICRDLGYAHVAAPTTTTFNKSKHIAKIESKRKPRVTFTYKCNCQTHEMSKLRHNKILNGAKYTCRTCNSYLVKA